MDCGQNLSLPKDIAWERLAFSPDMFDTNFEDPGLPPKWRTSLAAFYYVVPEEETKDNYPDRRIMYLRVIASITGCNLASDGLLLDEFKKGTFKKLKDKFSIDAFQESTLETVTGKLNNYYPCRGAILQVAVFPHPEDKVGSDLWRYPYIQDFEPKKRELYETVSKSGEVLAGSSSALNLKKGTTTAESVEESDILTGVSVKAGGWGVSAETSVSGKWGTEKKSEKEQSEIKTTDTSKEKRETQSHTTNLNQMYQPLLSYHLGTNRALWTISPRPHIVDSEFNLIDVKIRDEEEKEETKGITIGRKLEGIQDMFLVVNMPKNSKGICFQASLDAGYDFYNAAIDTSWFLIVMRRVIQSCGKFDKDGNFKIDYFPGRFKWAYERQPYVVNEIQIPPGVLIQTKDLNNLEKKTELVFKANERSQHIIQRMSGGYSSRVYEPRPFVETNIFRAVVESSFEESTYKLSEFEFMSKEKELSKQLKGRQIETIGDLMGEDYERDLIVQPVRQRILNSTLDIGKKIADYQREQYEKPQRQKP